MFLGNSSPDWAVQSGDRITILSIDGGGVRGVIPVRILQFLEKELQAIDGPDVRLADYFDIIAGTSTGGLIAGMLTCPDGKGRPRFTADDALKFYTDDSKSIFVRRPRIVKLLSSLIGPRYSPKCLEAILEENLRDVRMSDTVTELVVPTFDIKKMDPMIFSTSQAKEDPLVNPYLREVLRGTSAAPTYFPPTFFRTIDAPGKSREFNLVDGGVAINNPAYVAVQHVVRENFKESTSFPRQMKPQDFQKLLVISLGTGTVAMSYDAEMVSRWGIFSWIQHDGKVPILNVTSQGSADVVDMNMSTLFQTLECPSNYLRIQDLRLPKNVASIDDSSTKNVKRLIKVGDKLLDTMVKFWDINTGAYTPQNGRGTNKEALKWFAKELVQERVSRIQVPDDQA